MLSEAVFREDAGAEGAGALNDNIGAVCPPSAVFPVSSGELSATSSRIRNLHHMLNAKTFPNWWVHVSR